MNFIKLVFRYLCFLVRVILQKNKLPKNIINFKNDIIKDDRLYYAYNDIEKIRECQKPRREEGHDDDHDAQHDDDAIFVENFAQLNLLH